MSEAGGRYRGSAPSGPFVDETSVLARSLVSAEPSPHDKGFKGKRKGCKGWGRSQPWTSKHHRSRTWCRPRARTTHLLSRGSDPPHHVHPVCYPSDHSSRRPGPRAINSPNAPPEYLPGGALRFVDRSDRVSKARNPPCAGCFDPASPLTSVRSRRRMWRRV